jgi:hypothetical protein
MVGQIPEANRLAGMILNFLYSTRAKKIGFFDSPGGARDSFRSQEFFFAYRKIKFSFFLVDFNTGF